MQQRAGDDVRPGGGSLGLAGVHLPGPGALTSLVLTGPMLDLALRWSRPGWRLYAGFVLAGALTNIGAFLARGGFKYFGLGGLGGGRRFAEWLPVATWTYALAGMLAGRNLVVDWAMRYGNPSIESRLTDLVARGCDRILIMPLYPQYSSATTATVCDEVFRVLMAMRRQPTIRVAAPYYDDTVYIDALATSIKAELARLSFEPQVMLGSAGQHARAHRRANAVALDHLEAGSPHLRVRYGVPAL